MYKNRNKHLQQKRMPLRELYKIIDELGIIQKQENTKTILVNHK